jgi:integrase
MPTSPTGRVVRHDVRVARRRRRGEGTVFYSHAERAWVARVSLGSRDGKRVRRKVRASTELGARQKLEALQRAHRAGAAPPTQPLDRYLAEWLPAQLHLRPSTRATYEIHIRLYIAPLLGGIPLGELHPRDVRRLVTDLQRRGKSPGYVHLVIRTLSAALGAAVADRIVGDSATAGVKLPKLDREPVPVLTRADADAILDAVAGTWVERPVRVWLGSGLRRGEVLGLDQGDLMLDEGFVRVRISKTTVRAVPVNDDAVAALREALTAAPRRGVHEPVFFGERTGDRLRGDSITHALPRILERAGIGHLTPHALRHGAASLMLAQGHSIRVISEQLGHRNPAITARVYAHVIPEAQRSAVSALDRRQKG